MQYERGCTTKWHASAEEAEDELVSEDEWVPKPRASIVQAFASAAITFFES